jgi:hypothetical protein
LLRWGPSDLGMLAGVGAKFHYPPYCLATLTSRDCGVILPQFDRLTVLKGGTLSWTKWTWCMNSVTLRSAYEFKIVSTFKIQGKTFIVRLNIFSPRFLGLVCEFQFNCLTVSITHLNRIGTFSPLKLLFLQSFIGSHTFI